MCVLLPKISGYVKKFDNAKTICFLVKNLKLLTKYIKFGEKLIKNVKEKRKR